MRILQGFFGVLDGRDSWSNVGLYDQDAKGGFKKYPAYDYAENYGINNGFAKFEKGWYLPIAAEAVWQIFRLRTENFKAVIKEGPKRKS